MLTPGSPGPVLEMDRLLFEVRLSKILSVIPSRRVLMFWSESFCSCFTYRHSVQYVLMFCSDRAGLRNNAPFDWCNA